MSSGKLELKITKDQHGKKTELTSLSVKETEALVTILNAVVSLVKEVPDAENMSISVEEGSAAVVAQGNNNQIEKLFNDFEDVINFESTQKSIVEPWKNIQSLFLANGLHYEANFHKNNNVSEIYSKIKKSNSFRKKPSKIKYTYELSFVKGKLIEIGGKNPNIHLTNNQEEKIKIECTEIDAIKVNRFLYNEVYLSVFVKKKGSEIVERLFCDYYTDTKMYEEFKSFLATDINSRIFLDDLFDKCIEIIDSGDFPKLRKFMLLFKHNCFSASILKTLLVITKGLKERDEINKVRKSIKELLEFKTSFKRVNC